MISSDISVVEKFYRERRPLRHILPLTAFGFRIRPLVISFFILNIYLLIRVGSAVIFSLLVLIYSSSSSFSCTGDSADVFLSLTMSFIPQVSYFLSSRRILGGSFSTGSLFRMTPWSRSLFFDRYRN
jgi:hypothetical protein